LSVDLTIHVQPKSSQNKIVFDGTSAKVWVSAPPVDGEANEAICKLFSKQVKVPKSKISIVRGHSSREKTLRFEGIAEKELYERLNNALQ
jgi:uncharacterized protein (TIGR00251 family)